MVLRLFDTQHHAAPAQQVERSPEESSGMSTDATARVTATDSAARNRVTIQQIDGHRLVVATNLQRTPHALYMKFALRQPLYPAI
jgi:hypothetical protein